MPRARKFPIHSCANSETCDLCNDVLSAAAEIVTRSTFNGSVRKYGLDSGSYTNLLLLQRGTCAICRQPPPANKRLVVDHDHETGGVRGLLCGPCNTLLGMARDNYEILTRARNYLRAPPTKRKERAGPALSATR
jgi:Recombination endonuclease VII